MMNIETITDFIVSFYSPLSVSIIEDSAETVMYRIEGTFSDTVFLRIPNGGYFSAFRVTGKMVSAILFIHKKHFTFHYEGVYRA